MVETQYLPYSVDALGLAVAAAMSFADVEWDTMVFDYELSPTHSLFNLVEPAEEEDDDVLVPRELLVALVDDEECSFDHHGGCQAHGYLSLEPGEVCPQRELKDLLRRT